jgi:hypothetical protein
MSIIFPPLIASWKKLSWLLQSISVGVKLPHANRLLLLSSGDVFLSGSGVEVIPFDVYFTFVAWDRAREGRVPWWRFL